MRARSLFSLPVLASLAIAGCAVESSPTNDPESTTEEGQRTDELTASEGTAIWTKIYRPANSGERVITEAVATDSNGDTYVVRTTFDRTSTWPVPVSDLSRYGATGELELRRTLSRGQRVVGLAVGGGVVATIWNSADVAAPASVVAYDAATGNTRWRKDLRDNGMTVQSVAVDSSGRVIVVGWSDGQVTIDGRNVVDQNGRAYQGTIVARFYSGGTFAWAQRYGAASNDETTYVNVSDVAVDSDGEIYVSGTFGKDVDFGGGTTFSNAETWSEDGSATRHRIDDGYVLKLAPWGAKRWATQLSGPAEQLPMKIAVTGAGRVAVAGNFRTAVNFAGGSLEASDAESHFTTKAFFAKLDTSGKHVWSEKLEGTSESNVSVARVMLDDDGRVVLAGTIRGTATHEGTTYGSDSINRSVAFLGTFGATTGNRFWMKTYGEAGSDVHARSAAITSSGRIMLGGDFFGSVDFGRGVVTHTNESPQSSAGFLARLRE